MPREDESGAVLEDVARIHPVVDRLRQLLASATLLDMKASAATYWADRPAEDDPSWRRAETA